MSLLTKGLGVGPGTGGGPITVVTLVSQVEVDTPNVLIDVDQPNTVVDVELVDDFLDLTES